MTYPRTSTYLYATWISRYLTGDKSCLWACWFKANYQGYDRMPSDFDSARWNMEHTDLLNELVAELEERDASCSSNARTRSGSKAPAQAPWSAASRT